MKTITISFIILLCVAANLGIGFSAANSDLTKHITSYPKGHEATVDHTPELVKQYNKQHFSFTDAQDMYPKQAKKKGK